MGATLSIPIDQYILKLMPPAEEEGKVSRSRSRTRSPFPLPARSCCLKFEVTVALHKVSSLSLRPTLRQPSLCSPAAALKTLSIHSKMATNTTVVNVLGGEDEDGEGVVRSQARKQKQKQKKRTKDAMKETYKNTRRQDTYS